MADTKNETGKTSSTEKQPGTDPGAGAKVSAGTSVGNMGQAPMPHAASGAASDTQSSQQGKGQGASTAEKAQNAAKQTGTQARATADQARQRAGEAYEGASEWARDTYERASDWASGQYEQQRHRAGRMRGRSRKMYGQGRDTVQHYVAENPMVVGLVGLAAGLLIGALLPRTRREDEMFGEWADEVRQQGMRYAREAADRGREYVEGAFSGEEEGFSRPEGEFQSERTDMNRH